MSNVNSNTVVTSNAFLAAMQSKMPNLQACNVSELNNKTSKLETAHTKLIARYEEALEKFNDNDIKVKRQYGLIVKDNANKGAYIVKLKYGIYNLDLDGMSGYKAVARDEVEQTVKNIIEFAEQGLLDDALEVTFAARASNDDATEGGDDEIEAAA